MYSEVVPSCEASAGYIHTESAALMGKQDSADVALDLIRDFGFAKQGPTSE